MGGLSFSVESLYFAIQTLKLLDENLNELGSFLGTIDISGVELANSGLLSSAKSSIDTMINTTIKDLNKRLDDTKNILLESDAEAALLFSMLDGEFLTDTGEIDSEKLMRAVVDVVSKQEDFFATAEEYNKTILQYEEKLKKISDQIKVYENNKSLFGGFTTSSLDYNTIKSSLDKVNEAEVKIPELESEKEALTQAMMMLEVLRDYSLNSAYSLYTQYDDFDSVVSNGRKLFSSEYKEQLEYFTTDEVQIATYLLNTGASERLEQYFNLKEDVVNQRKGLEMAEDVMKTVKGFYGDDGIDGNYEDILPNAGAVMTLAGVGFFDGIGNFFDGFENLFSADGAVSADQYKTSYLVQMLQEFYGEENFMSLFSTGTYEISNSIGNMAIPMAVSAITHNPKLGTTLMGLSAAGNSREQGLQSGMTDMEAWVYGTLSGSSEAVIGYFLGGIPGLNHLDEVAEIPGLKGYISKLFMEGTEEATQSILDPFFAAISAKVTGEEVEAISIDWNDVLKSGVYGMITAGLLNGGQLFAAPNVQSVTDTSSLGDMKFEMDGVTYVVPADKAQELIDKFGTQNLEDEAVLAEFKKDLERLSNKDTDITIEENALVIDSENGEGIVSASTELKNESSNTKIVVDGTTYELTPESRNQILDKYNGKDLTDSAVMSEYKTDIKSLANNSDTNVIVEVSEGNTSIIKSENGEGIVSASTEIKNESSNTKIVVDGTTYELTPESRNQILDKYNGKDLTDSAVMSEYKTDIKSLANNSDTNVIVEKVEGEMVSNQNGVEIENIVPSSDNSSVQADQLSIEASMSSGENLVVDSVASGKNETGTIINSLASGVSTLSAMMSPGMLTISDGTTQGYNNATSGILSSTSDKKSASSAWSKLVEFTKKHEGKKMTEVETQEFKTLYSEYCYQSFMSNFSNGENTTLIDESALDVRLFGEQLDRTQKGFDKFSIKQFELRNKLDAIEARKLLNKSTAQDNVSETTLKVEYERVSRALESIARNSIEPIEVTSFDVESRVAQFDVNQDSYNDAVDIRNALWNKLVEVSNKIKNGTASQDEFASFDELKTNCINQLKFVSLMEQKAQGIIKTAPLINESALDMMLYGEQLNRTETGLDAMLSEYRYADVAAKSKLSILFTGNNLSSEGINALPSQITQANLLLSQRSRLGDAIDSIKRGISNQGAIEVGGENISAYNSYQSVNESGFTDKQHYDETVKRRDYAWNELVKMSTKIRSGSSVNPNEIISLLERYNAECRNLNDIGNSIENMVVEASSLDESSLDEVLYGRKLERTQEGYNEILSMQSDVRNNLMNTFASLFNSSSSEKVDVRDSLLFEYKRLSYALESIKRSGVGIIDGISFNIGDISIEQQLQTSYNSLIVNRTSMLNSLLQMNEKIKNGSASSYEKSQFGILLSNFKTFCSGIDGIERSLQGLVVEASSIDDSVIAGLYNNGATGVYDVNQQNTGVIKNGQFVSNNNLNSLSSGNNQDTLVIGNLLNLINNVLQPVSSSNMQTNNGVNSMQSGMKDLGNPMLKSFNRLEQGMDASKQNAIANALGNGKITNEASSMKQDTAPIIENKSVNSNDSGSQPLSDIQRMRYEQEYQSALSIRTDRWANLVKFCNKFKGQKVTDLFDMKQIRDYVNSYRVACKNVIDSANNLGESIEQILPIDESMLDDVLYGQKLERTQERYNEIVSQLKSISLQLKEISARSQFEKGTVTDFMNKQELLTEQIRMGIAMDSIERTLGISSQSNDVVIESGILSDVGTDVDTPAETIESTTGLEQDIGGSSLSDSGQTGRKYPKLIDYLSTKYLGRTFTHDQQGYYEIAEIRDKAWLELKAIDTKIKNKTANDLDWERRDVVVEQYKYAYQIAKGIADSSNGSILSTSLPFNGENIYKSFESSKDAIKKAIRFANVGYYGKFDALGAIDTYLKTGNEAVLGSRGPLKVLAMNMDKTTLQQIYEQLVQERSTNSNPVGIKMGFEKATDLGTSLGQTEDSSIRKKVSNAGYFQFAGTDVNSSLGGGKTSVSTDSTLGHGLNEVTKSQEYSDYTLQSIKDECSNYQEICDLFISSTSDMDTKAKLEQILYLGGYNGFGFDSNYASNNNPRTEMQRRMAMASLLLKNPTTFDMLINNKVNLFHGTNSRALSGIIKHGLDSLDSLNEKNIPVLSGEKSTRLALGRKVISFTDVLDVAVGYSSLSHDESSFEVVIGTSIDEAKKSGITSFGSDVPEIAIKNKLPVEGIKVMLVPSSKIDLVRNMVSGTNIEVLALDYQQNEFYFVEEGVNKIYIDYDAFNELHNSDTTTSGVVGDKIITGENNDLVLGGDDLNKSSNKTVVGDSVGMESDSASITSSLNDGIGKKVSISEFSSTQDLIKYLCDRSLVETSSNFNKKTSSLYLQYMKSKDRIVDPGYYDIYASGESSHPDLTAVFDDGGSGASVIPGTKDRFSREQLLELQRSQYDYRITINNSSNINIDNAKKYVSTLISECRNRGIDIRMKNYWERDAIILYCHSDQVLETVRLLEDLSDSSKFGEDISSVTKSFGPRKPFTVGLNDDSYYGISMYVNELPFGVKSSNVYNSLILIGGGDTFSGYTGYLLENAYNNLLVKYNNDVDKITDDEFYDEMIRVHKKYMFGSEDAKEDIPLWMNRRNYQEFSSFIKNNDDMSTKSQLMMNHLETTLSGDNVVNRKIEVDTPVDTIGSISTEGTGLKQLVQEPINPVKVKMGFEKAADLDTSLGQIESSSIGNSAKKVEYFQFAGTDVNSSLGGEQNLQIDTSSLTMEGTSFVGDPPGRPGFRGMDSLVKAKNDVVTGEDSSLSSDLIVNESGGVLSNYFTSDGKIDVSKTNQVNISDDTLKLVADKLSKGEFKDLHSIYYKCQAYSIDEGALMIDVMKMYFDFIRNGSVKEGYYSASEISQIKSLSDTQINNILLYGINDNLYKVEPLIANFDVSLLTKLDNALSKFFSTEFGINMDGSTSRSGYFMRAYINPMNAEVHSKTVKRYIAKCIENGLGVKMKAFGQGHSDTQLITDRIVFYMENVEQLKVLDEVTNEIINEYEDAYGTPTLFGMTSDTGAYSFGFGQISMETGRSYMEKLYRMSYARTLLSSSVEVRKVVANIIASNSELNLNMSTVNQILDDFINYKYSSLPRVRRTGGNPVDYIGYGPLNIKFNAPFVKANHIYIAVENVIKEGKIDIPSIDISTFKKDIMTFNSLIRWGDTEHLMNPAICRDMIEQGFVEGFTVNSNIINQVTSVEEKNVKTGGIASSLDETVILSKCIGDLRQAVDFANFNLRGKNALDLLKQYIETGNLNVLDGNEYLKNIVEKMEPEMFKKAYEQLVNERRNGYVDVLAPDLGINDNSSLSGKKSNFTLPGVLDDSRKKVVDPKSTELVKDPINPVKVNIGFEKATDLDLDTSLGQIEGSSIGKKVSNAGYFQFAGTDVNSSLGGEQNLQIDTSSLTMKGTSFVGDTPGRSGFREMDSLVKAKNDVVTGEDSSLSSDLIVNESGGVLSNYFTSDNKIDVSKTQQANLSDQTLKLAADMISSGKKLDLSSITLESNKYDINGYSLLDDIQRIYIESIRKGYFNKDYSSDELLKINSLTDEQIGEILNGRFPVDFDSSLKNKLIEKLSGIGYETQNTFTFTGSDNGARRNHLMRAYVNPMSAEVHSETIKRYVTRCIERGLNVRSKFIEGIGKSDSMVFYFENIEQLKVLDEVTNELTREYKNAYGTPALFGMISDNGSYSFGLNSYGLHTGRQYINKLYETAYARTLLSSSPQITSLLSEFISSEYKFPLKDARKIVDSFVNYDYFDLKGIIKGGFSYGKFGRSECFLSGDNIAYNLILLINEKNLMVPEIDVALFRKDIMLINSLINWGDRSYLVNPAISNDMIESGLIDLNSI